MRMAKSSKIVLLFITMALSLIAFLLCFLGAQSVYAVNPKDAGEYFSSSETVEFKNDGVSATLKEEGTLTIDSALALDNLGFEIKLDTKIKKLGVKVPTLPYLVNGNVIVNADGEKELIETVEHDLAISVNGTDLTVVFNGETANATLSGNLDVAFKTIDNVLYAMVEGVEVYSEKAEYKVYDLDTCIVEDITFEVIDIAEGSEEAELLILSVDQDVTDTSGKYKQLFKLNSDGEVEKLATPYGVVASSVTSVDGKIYMESLYKNTLSLRGLSVLGELKNTALRLTKTNADDDEIWLENVENPKSVLFKKAGVKYINIETNLNYENKVLKTLEVNVFDEDTVAPVYNTALVSTEAYEAYKLAVVNATKTEDGYIKLGEDYTVPSLENFVSDDIVAYNNLNATVYYKTPTEDNQTTTDFSIPIESAGDYTFYVAFEDAFENGMKEEDFFTVSEEDENQIEKGIYYDFVFHFHIEDDSEVAIEARNQGKGYVGQAYTATDFKINASGYTKTYQLFYNSKVDALASDSGWVEIIAKENLKDNYENAVFTADDIKAINFSGTTTFTPDRIGSYKLKCTIVSDSSTRSADAEAVISVEKATTVKPVEALETREILAIVFLSVGGLCLIGIVALIFVKPKEKTDAE